LSADAPKLAFKTGTSYGFRDAVAAGVGDRWTVLVWTGRPDGGARPGLTGRDAALPLLFQVFDSLEGEASPAQALAPRSAPSGLVKVDPAEAGPQMLFPPDGSSVLVDDFGPTSRGLVLTARGEGLRWYVDATPIPAGPGGAPPVWRPAGRGFYTIMAIDSHGRRTRSRVQVR